MRKIIAVLFVFLLMPCTVLSETIIDIFPDANVARFVRDAVGAFDVTDEITQDKLDTIWLFADFEGYGEIHDITGISRLHGASMIRLSCHWQSDVMLEELPDEITTMDWVTWIEASNLHDLKNLPNDIGNMKALQGIELDNCGITELPESICNLENLEILNISGCPIERLPENIGNLRNLKRLDISNTKISYLPESIRNLNLESFNRSRTPL